MSSFFKKEFTFDRVARIFFISVCVAIFGFICYRIRDALIPFIIGWILAAALMPIVRFFQYRLHLKVRLLAILATVILILGVLTALFFLFVPPTIAEFKKTGDLIIKFEENIKDDDYLPPQVRDYIGRFVDFKEYKEKFNSKEAFEYVKRHIPQLIDIISKAVFKVFTLISVVFIFLYCFFIMLYFEKIQNGFFDLLPESWKGSVRKVISDLANSTGRYFRGQSLIASIVGVLFCIGFLIIGIPLAIPLGLFIGMLNMIPYAQFIGLFPTILLCGLHSADTGIPFWRLIVFCLILFTVVQVTQDTILTPNIMNKVTGLNPAIILLCLTIGGTLFGVLGIIMALPLAPMMLTYYHTYILKKPMEVPESEKKPDKRENNKE